MEPNQNPFASFADPSQDAQATSGANPFATYGEGGYDTPYDEKQVEIQNGDWLTDTLGTSRAFVEGLTLGWGDEAGLAIAAAAASASSNESYSDIYRQMKDRYDAEKAAFKQASPVLSTSAEIAGAIASPINLLKPLQAVSGAKILASPTVQAVTRAGLEGAAYGAGTATNAEDMGKEALVGGLTGSLFTGVIGTGLKGGSWLMNAATKRRITQSLDTADGFVPLHLAADVSDSGESALGGFYRTIVGPSFGSAMLRAQEIETSGKAFSREFRVAEALDKVKRNAKDAIAAAKQKIGTVKDLKLTKTSEGIEDVRTGVKQATTAAAEKLDAKKANIYNTIKEMDDAIEDSATAFRMEATRQSIPDGVKPADIQRVMDAKSPNEAMGIIDELWSSYGFRALTTNTRGGPKKFRLNASALAANLEKRLASKDYLELQAATKGEMQREIGKVIDYIGKNIEKGGFIDGGKLSAARSNLGSLAAAKSDAGGPSVIQMAIYKEAQDAIHDMIVPQLSGKAKDEFLRHREQWKMVTTLRDAVLKASREGGKTGRFTPNDWVAAIAKNSPRQARQGGGPLRELADEVGAQFNARAKTLKDAENALVNQATKERIAEVNKARAEAASELKRLRAEQKQIRGKAAVDVKTAERRLANRSRISELETKDAQLKQQAEALREAAIAKYPSVFQRLFATGLMGGGYDIANLLTGSMLSRGLSTRQGQRIVAGQTPWQMAKAAQAPQREAARLVNLGRARNVGVASAGLISDALNNQ